MCWSVWRSEYVTDVDANMARQAIQCIARIATQVPSAADHVVDQVCWDGGDGGDGDGGDGGDGAGDGVDGGGGSDVVVMVMEILL